MWRQKGGRLPANCLPNTDAYATSIGLLQDRAVTPPASTTPTTCLNRYNHLHSWQRGTARARYLWGVFPTIRTTPTTPTAYAPGIGSLQGLGIAE